MVLMALKILVTIMTCIAYIITVDSYILFSLKKDKNAVSVLYGVCAIQRHKF